MVMCIQNLVKFCPLVLKILSGNEMVTDLRNSGIVELRNSGITEGQGKSNIAPTFSKRGYNKHQQFDFLLHNILGHPQGVYKV